MVRLEELTSTGFLYTIAFLSKCEWIFEHIISRYPRTYTTSTTIIPKNAYYFQEVSMSLIKTTLTSMDLFTYRQNALYQEYINKTVIKFKILGSKVETHILE